MVIMPRIVAAFAFSLAGSVVIAAMQSVAPAPAAIPLFSPPPENAVRALGQAPLRDGELRRREVQVRLDALGGTYGAGPAEPRLELTLFPGETRVAALDYLETTLEGRSWIGHLEGVELSSVILTVTHGVVAGSVSWPGGHTFRIYPAASGTYSVSEVNDSLPPVDDVVVPLASRSDSVAAGLSVEPPIARADDPSVVDMLVIFNPGVRQEVGSYAAVAAGIDLHVSNVNRAMANSRVPTRVRLVQTLEIPVALRANCSDTLNSIRDTTDGNLDEVGALRDAYGADLVHVLLFPTPSDCSGIAYSPDPPQAGFAFGLSTLIRTLGSPMPHEVGHNFGGLHDWFNDATRTSRKGYVNCSAGFADLTSYGNECAARGLPVSGIPHFSNPSVQYQGRPTGVPRGTGLECRVGNLNNPPCDADVASTMIESIGAIANFRASRFVASSFPPRNESLDFRAQLEAKYRDGLRRPVAGSYADPEGAVVWTVDTCVTVSGSVATRWRSTRCSGRCSVKGSPNLADRSRARSCFPLAIRPTRFASSWNACIASICGDSRLTLASILKATWSGSRSTCAIG